MPTCQDSFGIAPGTQPTGYASAVLKGNGSGANTNYSSGFETGFLTFEESCGQPCSHDGYLGSPLDCDGVCVSGNFWGLIFLDPMLPNMSGIHIHEFAAACASLPSGCSQTGGMWNPDVVAHGLPSEDPHEAGSLGNVAYNPLGQCFSSGFMYCAPATDFALSGPNSIIGRSVVLHAMEDGGASGLPSESAVQACGTIT